MIPPYVRTRNYDIIIVGAGHFLHYGNCCLRGFFFLLLLVLVLEISYGVYYTSKYNTGNYYYCIKNTTDVWHLTPPANINTNTSTACDTSRIKVDITDTMVLRKMIRSSYVYNSNPPSNHIT